MTEKAEVKFFKLDEIKRAEKNPKKHDIAELRKSIRRFGFISPLLRNEKDGRLIAGHGRLEALQSLKEAGHAMPSGLRGDWEAPVITGLSFKNEKEAKAYLVADNRLVELGGWSEQELGSLLQDVQVNTEQALEGVGFSEKDLDSIMQKAGIADSPEEQGDEVEPEPRCKKGEIWQLGEHFLSVSNCSDLFSFMKKKKATADLMVTDPPYGVDYGSKQEALNRADGGKRNTHKIKDDAKVPDEMAELWVEWFTGAVERLKKGGVIYVCGPGAAQLFARLVMSLEKAGAYVPQHLVWVKNQQVLGRSDYHGKHENIAYGWKKGASHMALSDRSQNSVWEIDKPRKAKEHPTMKPLELMQRMVVNSSRKKEIVLEPFCGSGTTLLAAEAEGRICYASELSEQHCDTIIKRWELATGGTAKKIDEPEGQ